MSYFEKNAIVSGLGISRIGRRTGVPGAELTLEAARAAIDDAGLTADDIDGIAVYSPRAAERIAGLLGRPGSGWRGTIFCLSQGCADRLSIPDGPMIRVADEPSKGALHNVVHQTWRH